MFSDAKIVSKMYRVVMAIDTAYLCTQTNELHGHAQRHVFVSERVSFFRMHELRVASNVTSVK